MSTEYWSPERTDLYFESLFKLAGVATGKDVEEYITFFRGEPKGAFTRFCDALVVISNKWSAAVDGTHCRWELNKKARRFIPKYVLFYEAAAKTEKSKDAVEVCAKIGVMDELIGKYADVLPLDYLRCLELTACQESQLTVHPDYYISVAGKPALYVYKCNRSKNHHAFITSSRNEAESCFDEHDSCGVLSCSSLTGLDVPAFCGPTRVANPTVRSLDHFGVFSHPALGI